MTQIKNYNFDKTQVTAIAPDTSTTNHLWIAYAKNSDNVCILRKVSAHDLDQVYYEIEFSVDEITSLHIFGSYLYLAVDDATYLGYKLSLNSPLTIQTAIDIPAGITEAPIDIDDDGTYVYYLLPGDISGTISKILKYTTALSLNTTITLTAITGVKSFTIDSNSDIWCITYSSPSKLIRVYDDGGYTFSTTLLGI